VPIPYNLTDLEKSITSLEERLSYYRNPTTSEDKKEEEKKEDKPVEVEKVDKKVYI
jgi:hypothetical protein